MNVTAATSAGNRPAGVASARLGVGTNAVVDVDLDVVYLGYGLAVSYYLIRFRSTILRSEFLLLAMALLSFAVSIAVDRFGPEDTAGHLLEDGAKLVGIMSWLTYFFRTGLSAVKSELVRKNVCAPPD